MGGAAKIMRRAFHAFFKHYHPAASAAALLVLPFSAAALLSRSPALFPPPLLAAASRRLRRALVAGGFPPASQLLFLLNHKLAQSAFSFLTTLPFSLTSLLLAKACTVQFMQRHRHVPVAALLRSYPPLVSTQLLNLVALLSSNAAVFAALLAAFNAMDALRVGSDRAVLALSSVGVIVYSVSLANVNVVCNLATVVAAAEGRGGCHALLKALLLVRGHAATAVAAVLPASLGTAAVEGLFQFRVVRAYKANARLSMVMALEALLVAYIHASHSYVLVEFEGRRRCTRFLCVRVCKPRRERRVCLVFWTKLPRRERRICLVFWTKFFNRSEKRAQIRTEMFWRDILLTSEFGGAFS